MKKLLSSLIVAVFLCSSLNVYAASVGSAETQGQGKLNLGVDQEFLFDRNMKRGTYDNGETEYKPDVKIYRTMAKISYGLFNGLDIYVRLGAADFKGDSDIKYLDSRWTNGVDIGKWKQNGDYAFAYGAGIKGAYTFMESWIIGCDVQYLRHKNDFKGTESWDAYNGAGTLQYSRSYPISGSMLFQEWQGAVYIAKKIENFTPYVGAKYSDLRTENRMQFSSSSDIYKYNSKADDNIGVFVGTDCKIAKNWNLNVEGRFIDETAMSFGASYKF